MSPKPSNCSLIHPTPRLHAEALLPVAALEDGRRRFGIAPLAAADFTAQVILDALSGAIEAELTEVMIDRAARREVLRQHAPGDAAAQDIEDGTEEMAHIDFARASTSFDGRDQILDRLPYQTARDPAGWPRRPV